MSEDLVVVSIKEHLSCELADEIAILNMRNDSYYALNPVGAFVWKLLAEPRKVGDIRDALVAAYDVKADQCLKDLVALLSELMDNGLIEVAKP